LPEKQLFKPFEYANVVPDNREREREVWVDKQTSPSTDPRIYTPLSWQCWWTANKTLTCIFQIVYINIELTKRHEAEVRAEKTVADYKALLATINNGGPGKSASNHLQVW